jgi:hypothetical protein
MAWEQDFERIKKHVEGDGAEPTAMGGKDCERESKDL